MKARRLTSNDRDLAKRLFVLMAEVFEEDHDGLGDAYVDRLLSRVDFWAIAAFTDDGDLVGGLTAHTLPMTRAEASEIFIYDIAVRPDQQRKGIGRLLMTLLRREAASIGVQDVFVPADDDDAHALDFYRALGGAPSPVTIFSFSGHEG
jgi:aminoglycoside 3-N-acetyltransferase I